MGKVGRLPKQQGMGNEQRYFDALKRITQYQPVSRLQRHGDSDWGLGYPESLEMAYENVIQEARAAIKGKRRPGDLVRQSGP